MMNARKYAIQMLDKLRSLSETDFLNEKIRNIYSETVKAMKSLPETDIDFLLLTLEKEYIAAIKGESSFLTCQPISEALAAYEAQRAVPIICRILIDPDASMVREDTAEILGEMNDPSAVPFLIQILSSTEAGIRAKAVESLGMLKDRRAIQPLLKLLNDSFETVREYTVNALVRLEAKEASSKLITVLRDDDDLYVRIAAAKALGELKISDAIAILKEIVGKETNSDLVEEAQNALAKI